MTLQRTIGLDIGGANLKAVHADGAHRTAPFALWKQPEQLPAALKHILQALPPFDALAVTMTGELCDCFAGKHAGVNAILDAVQSVAEACPVRVWSLDGFIDIATARTRFLRVASANWHALAMCLAQEIAPRAGLLIDIGSTTTDIIPLANGRAIATGATDPDRLRHGELVYTGVRRTPLCALLGFDVAAELFATTLDVNLMLGWIAEDARDKNTADGQPATRPAAHARLSRMLCADQEMFSIAEAVTLAQRALDRQVAHLAAAIERVIAVMPKTPDAIILGGSGEFLGRLAWERLLQSSKGDRRMCTLDSLASRWGEGLSTAACAHALTILSVS